MKTPLQTEISVLKFWKDAKIFEKSVEQRKTAPFYSFFDGPPFGTGTPHFGHLLQSLAKDTVLRYWTQKGYYVPRRWGWDCHGAPIEVLVEKKLEIKDKREIENTVGVENFNANCRNTVLMYDQVWRQTIERLGRWVDMDDQYRTMDNDFIESVWWGLGELYHKNLLYKDYRISLYSPTVGVPLSHTDIAMEVIYKEETAQTPIIRFALTPISAKKLYKKIVDEVALEYSEQIRVKMELSRKIDVLENLRPKVVEVGHFEKKVTDFKAIEWESFQTKEESELNISEMNLEIDAINLKLDDANSIKAILGNYDTLSILVWTTTPWTLPANVAVAVGSEMDYGIYQESETGEMLIVAQKLAQIVLTNKNCVKIANIKGEDLAGLEYTPIFEVPLKFANLEQKNNIYKVYCADFVSDSDGTGAVHIAPAYGDTDFELGNTVNLPVLYSLDASGEMLSNLGGDLNDLAGSYFLKANKQINALLVENGKIYKVFPHLHKTPYYDRDGKAVYYCAQDGWFIAENKIKPTSLALNQQINWNPASFKDGRFGKGLETAPDWCISRKRYWGNPIPIWQTSNKDKTIFVQSVEELRQQAVNPIFRILIDKEFFPELYMLGKIVIFTDGSEKIPLGINAVQHRSRNLQALKEKPTSNLQEFATLAQPLLDEILSLFGKYNDIQIMLTAEEQRMWTTWLGTLHPKSKKSTKIFYFYKRVIEQDDELIPTGAVLALDLHKPYIDDIILKDKNGALYFRIDEVLDCWVESGSMPFASLHYPFENKELVERNFSADWICEAQDQTRGWFRTLHVLASGIFGQVAFKNINTTGLILALDGKKMSKSKMNYTDPIILLEKFGSDAVRNYLLSSVLLDAESFSFKDKDLETVFRDTTLMLSNTIKYAQFVFENNIPTLATKGYRHPLNQWWKAYTQNYVNKIVELMDRYEINDASRLIVPYIQDLSTWYIRRSKDILEDYGGEVASCLRETLKMFAKVTASLQPFNAEKIWSLVADEEDFESVHLTSISGITWNVNLDILDQMEELRTVASSIHSSRKSKNIRVRQPLSAYLEELHISKFEENNLWLDILTKECNLLSGVEADSEKYNYDGKFGKMSVNLEVSRSLSILGFARDFERAVQEFRKKQGYKAGQLVYTKWHLSEAKDENLFREVMGQTDWAKLKLEVKWNSEAPENQEKTIEVKDLVTIIVCS